MRNRIIKSLHKLENEPESGKPLTSMLTGLWSLSIGEYRAIYQIKNSELIVVITRMDIERTFIDKPVQVDRLGFAQCFKRILPEVSSNNHSVIKFSVSSNKRQ